MRPRAFALLGGAFVALFLTALLAINYWDRMPRADVSVALAKRTSQRDTPALPPDASKFRFAVAPVLSPRATLENYEALAAYLGERLERNVELIQGKSYAEINSLVRSGDVSLALVCSGAYVVGRREFGMEALAVPVVNGGKTYRSYLIVPASSTASKWDDLRDKTFAFTDPLSNSGRLVPVYVLSQMGTTPEKFFRDSVFTYSHDKSIGAVAEGLVSAAAVDSLVYDFMVQRDPFLDDRVKVIWRSPPYGINPMVVHPNVSPERRHKLEAVFLGMSSDPRGQEVLKRLGIDSFDRAEPQSYDKIEAMIRATGGW